jgi:hypothetical protein
MLEKEKNPQDGAVNVNGVDLRSSSRDEEQCRDIPVA